MTQAQIDKIYIKPTLKLGYGYYLIQKSLIEAVTNLKSKIGWKMVLLLLMFLLLSIKIMSVALKQNRMDTRW